MNEVDEKKEGMSIKIGGFTLNHLGMIGGGLLVIGLGIYIVSKIK